MTTIGPDGYCSDCGAYTQTLNFSSTGLCKACENRRKRHEGECIPCCDYCKFYRDEYTEDGEFAGNGYCFIHREGTLASDFCGDFECRVHGWGVK